MLEESRQCGLGLDVERERRVWKHGQEVAEPWRGRQHESLTWKWWPAEFFPKLQYWPKLALSIPAIGRGRNRYIADDAIPHDSTLKRMRNDALRYCPKNAPASRLSPTALASAEARPGGH